jgi:hypothetical protein
MITRLLLGIALAAQAPVQGQGSATEAHTAFLRPARRARLGRSWPRSSGARRW